MELTQNNQYGQAVEQLIYAYDPAGNRTKMERIEGVGDAASLIATQYTYDKGGNRLTKSTGWGDLLDLEAYSYNAGDQLTRWQNGLDYKDYAYDQRGNLLQVTGPIPRCRWRGQQRD